MQKGQGEKIMKYMWSPRNNYMTVMVSQWQKNVHLISTSQVNLVPIKIYLNCH